MTLNYRALTLVVAVLVGGCVAIDKRAWSEEVDKAATNTLSGTFLNHALYRSNGSEFVASDNLADALGFPARNADKVVVSFSPVNGLTLEFSRNQLVILKKTITFNDGLSLTDRGSIELPSAANCGGRDGPGFVCGTKSATIFVNASGELVCIESGGGAGVLGVIPIGLYARLVSIYTRETGDATIDNIPRY